MKERAPLYGVLAEIVHMEYGDAIHAIKALIPGQITAVISLFENLPLEVDRKESMRDSVMSYMYLAKNEYERFNRAGDYSDMAFNEILIHRFQVDAERTRIFLELRERDWEANVNFLELDF
jgi:hypothetical protein